MAKSWRIKRLSTSKIEDESDVETCGEDPWFVLHSFSPILPLLSSPHHRELCPTSFLLSENSVSEDLHINTALLNWVG